MVTTTQVNYTLNISLHILILFSFLTIFFFAFISHLEQKRVDDSLTSAINDQIGQVLDNMDKYAPTSGIKINWKTLNDIGEKIQKDAIGALPEVKKNHRKLLIVGISMIIGLFVLFSSLYVYFGVYKGVNINWKKILIENLIVFGFVGIIEYLFFTNVASKYVPITPDLLSNTILDRVKYHLYKYLSQA
jgi:putative flippase GtrA